MFSKKRFQKNKFLVAFSAFFLPFLLMALLYLFLRIYPGSERSVLASDAFSQFSNFHASYRNMLLGKQGLFYSWNASLGINFFALSSYYLGGFLTPLVVFFPNQLMPDALYFLTLIKIGLAGLAFYFYLKPFKFKTPLTLSFSTSYALMSFILAYSELIMWLDTFIFLPLIFLGIQKILQEKKPVLLFFSYFFLFISNFYFGFMIGIFSFLYFLTEVLGNWKTYKKNILTYIVTAGLAVTASMITILPTFLDLKTNGETLSKLTTLKTEATGPWDLIMKNFIGVYDTTKYGSIPFIYIGLIPLIFCLFYFVTKKIPLKKKILSFSLLALLTASFYLNPLNLFWHGFHAPNMFLFRYSFLFSFMVILLALQGFQHYEKSDYPSLLKLFFSLGILFLLGKIFAKGYDYLSIWSVILTFCFLFLYLFFFTFQYLDHHYQKILVGLLAFTMVTEATVNGSFMLNGILKDWNYASSSLFTEPYPEIKTLVKKSQKTSDTFYRLENLDPVSSNDAFNYGYSGISMFSSIRNRHSSSLLDALGFVSRGTNLNIRYNNNTLLADTLFGIKYNIWKNQPEKFGFQPFSHTTSYSLFENQYAPSLGIVTTPEIYQVNFPKRDNLTSQKNLFNALGQQQENYYTLVEPTVTQTENTKIHEIGNNVTYEEEVSQKGKILHFKVMIPKDTQAYLSLYPIDYSEMGSSSVTVSVKGSQTKSQLNITGQYHNLGYFPQATTLEFSTEFYGSQKVSFMKPKVLLLDTKAYAKTASAIQKQTLPFKAIKNGATTTYDLKQDQVLFTTIPFDQGWQAFIDGKKVPIQAFKESLVTVKIPKGKHQLTFKFIPAGFKIGSLLCFISFLLFSFYSFILKKKSSAS